MKESDLLSQIIKTLYSVVRLFRGNAGTFYSKDGSRRVNGLPKGFPDCFGVILADKSANGLPVPVFIETKVHPNKPTPEQTKFIEEYRAGGCCAGICYSVSEAWRLIRPYIKPELDIYPEEVLKRWDMLSK